MKNTDILLTWDIILMNDTKYTVSWFLKWLDKNSYCILDPEFVWQPIIKKNIKEIKNFTIISHIDQDNDFIDNNWEVLRKTDIFMDKDNNHEENIWWVWIYIPSNSDNEELCYNKEEFRKDVQILVEKRNQEIFKDSLLNKAKDILLDIFKKTGVKYKITR